MNEIYIIGLNGSPHRNGNTVTLMNWVLDGCQEAGASTRLLHVVDFQIRYCQGCFACLRDGACPQKDDFLALRDLLTGADGFVVGSPVYENAPSAQMKTLMDRLTLLHLYTGVFEKQFTVGVATSGIAPTKDTADGLARFFGHKAGWIGATTTTRKDGPRSLAEVHDPRLPEKARALGRKLVAEISGREHARSILPANFVIYAIRRWFIRPMMEKNPGKFAGALEILRAKNWRYEG